MFNVNATIVENYHGSGSVSESQGGRTPEVDFGTGRVGNHCEIMTIRVGKAKAAGSRTLIFEDRPTYGDPASL